MRPDTSNRPHQEADDPMSTPRSRTAALVATLLLTASAAAAQAAPPRSIAELEGSLRSGKTTCRAVVTEALARIASVERGPLRPRAVLETNPDALGIADGLDGEQRAGTLRPLHCVTLLVKDNFETGDRLRTTVGSLTMGDFRATRDALVVARLRAAGAVVLGKTNMDEWAHGASGYSSRGGQTRNGLRPTRGPGGSSGGSASAVQKGLALVATGSDTGGSIQIPAHYNGVVGLRGTMGLISRDGVVPFASISDIPGVLTRTTQDTTRVLGFLTGVDPADPATRRSAGRSRTDYTRSLDATGLRGARIGVLRRVFDVPLTGDAKDVDRAFAASLKRMRGAGASVVELPALRGPQLRWIDVGYVSQRQFRPELNAWLAGPGRAAPVRSLRDLIATSERPPAASKVRVMRLLEAEQGAVAPRGADYERFLDGMRKFRAQVDGLLKRFRLEAIAFPNSSCAAPPLPGIVDRTYICKGVKQPLKRGGGGGSPAALISPATGLPVLVVPGPRLSGGLRLGLSLLGPAWTEPELLKLGYAYERLR